MKILVLFSIFVLSFSTNYMIAQERSDDIKIAGKTIALVANGDFVHPAISPDGNKLAYSRVVVQNKMELTEIAVLDLKTAKTRVLLTPLASKKYAAYSAFVSELRWLDNNRLFAVVPDGDVDFTELTFNASLGKIVKSRPSGGEEGMSAQSPEVKNAIKQIRLISPSMPEDVLRTAWDMSTYLEIPNRGYLIQTNYYRYDNSIRFYDFLNKKEKVLIEIPDTNPPYPRLAGGFTLGEKIVFAVADEKQIKIQEFNGENLATLAEKKLKTDESFWLMTKHSTPENVYLLIAPDNTRSSERSELWVYDKLGLKRSSDVSDLLDVDIRGGKIAFCFWANDKRNIVVKELLR